MGAIDITMNCEASSIFTSRNFDRDGVRFEAGLSRQPWFNSCEFESPYFNVHDREPCWPLMLPDI